MSYGAFGNPLSTNAAGAIGGLQTVGFDVLNSVGNILAFPFLTNTTDLTGNHTIDDGTPTLVTNIGGDPAYGGGSRLRINSAVGEAPRILASSEEHQVPLTSPVTFGMFMMATSWGGSTPQLMVSGPGANSSNYGMQRQSTVGWRYQGDGGTTTTLGDHRDITPTNRWFHWALVIDSTSRSTGGNPSAFYINGQELWTGNTNSGETVSTTDNFSFGSDSDEATASWTGFISHCFVADSALDATTIKALSDEAFGHASPYVE